MKYPWYDLVEGSEISQGDIIESCPVIIVPPVENVSEGDEIEVVSREIDVIVMTQACDLEQGNVDSVILCGLTPVREVKTRSGKSPDRGYFKDVKDGKVVALHLLSDYQSEELKKDYYCVDLRQLYSLPLKTLEAIARNKGKRLRLLPPYREHLSQAFARVFMRVGLPSDIDINKIDLD